MGKIFDYTRSIVIFLVGFTLMFLLHEDGFFAPILTLSVLSDVSPYLIPILGILAMVSGILIWFSKTRIIGYIIGIVVVGVFAICSILSLFLQPSPHSALGILLIPAAISYAGGMYLAVQDKYN